MTPPAAKIGRPSKLTATRHTLIVAAVATGATVDVAAKAAGIGERTLIRWQKRGREETERLTLADIDPEDEANVDPDELDYWQLWRDVERARAESEVYLLGLIQEAAQGYERTTRREKTITKPDGTVEMTVEEVTTIERSWQAAAWKLERRYPDKYGRRTRHEVTGAEGGPVELDLGELRQRVAASLDEHRARLEGAQLN